MLWWWNTYLSTQYHRIRVTGYLIAHTWKYNFLDLNMIVLSKHSFLAFFLKSLKSDGHGTMYLTMVILKSQKLCLILSLWESFGREVRKSCFWVHVAFYILNSESLLAKSKKQQVKSCVTRISAFNFVKFCLFILQLRQTKLHHEDEIMQLKEQVSDAQRYICDVLFQPVFISESVVSSHWCRLWEQMLCYA